MDIHPLDLPSLAKNPSFDQLNEIVTSLQVSIRNFDLAPQLPPHLLNWLSKVICDELSWLEPEQAESIHEMASKRVSQSCGVSATSNSTRLLDVGDLEFQLYEPGLTNDNIGHKTWGSCLIMAKKLLNQPDLLVGRVIELGSGTGVCGMVVAHLGNVVHLTDLPIIIENLQRNIEANQALFNATATCGVLDWSEPTSPGEFDTVIVSDPVYSAAAPQQIANTLSLLKVPRLLLQLPQRPNFEDLRQNLYNKIETCGYKRLLFEIEEGRDDFGPSLYAFSLWILH